MQFNTPANNTSGLTPTELDWLARFLEESAEEFDQHGCNDFELPATEENKAIIAAAFEHQGDDGYNFTVDEIMASEGQVYMYDHWVMTYFAHRCKELATRPDANPPLSPAEHRVIAILLDLIVDWYKEETEWWPEYVYPATPEDKALFAATFELEGKPDAAQAALEGTDEVDISDLPIHKYLADKCKALSGSVG
jgi:hypothetical protein